MEKYSESLTVLVMSVAEKAKQDGRMKPVRSIVLKNFPTATELQSAATELQDATATESQSVATSNLDSPNSPVQESLDCDPMTPSTSRVWETIVTPQPRRKRQASIVDTGLPLQSRKASLLMQNLMSQEAEIGQRTGRPRRDLAICSVRARRENLDSIS